MRESRKNRIAGPDVKIQSDKNSMHKSRQETIFRLTLKLLV